MAFFPSSLKIITPGYAVALGKKRQRFRPAQLHLSFLFQLRAPLSPFFRSG